MVFNVGKIRSTMQSIGQKLTPDKILQFGTKVRDTALQIGRKVSNTLGKISDVGHKLLPMAELLQHYVISEEHLQLVEFHLQKIL